VVEKKSPSEKAAVHFGGDVPVYKPKGSDILEVGIEPILA
jgi:hypothetical protein